MMAALRSGWALLFLVVAVRTTAYLNGVKCAKLNTYPLSRRQMTFKEFGFPEWLLTSCEKLGYREPTAVQQRALPVVIERKDTILQAQTGSGKTLTYALPVLSRIDPSRAAVQSVVVVPTRELGLQVVNMLRKLSLGSPCPITIMPVVEGSQNRRQVLWASAEPPHIVVGNPRSLLRLVNAGKLRLNAVDTVVVDEVDACLIEHHTRQELHDLLSRHLSSTYSTTEIELHDGVRESKVFRDRAKHLEVAAGLGASYHQQRQTIMCSATIPQRQHFAVQCFKQGWTSTVPELILVSEDALVPPQVRHEHIDLPVDQRLACLCYLLRIELSSGSNGEPVTKELSLPPEEENSAPKQAIVFVDDINAVDSVKRAIDKALSRSVGGSTAEEVGSAVGVMLETMSIDARAKAMEAFRRGHTRVLLCSDLGARGLDLPNTALVVQMRLPDRVEPYIHRAGRTGRLQRPGKVITFTQPEEAFVLRRYSNDIGVSIHERRVRPVLPQTQKL